MCSEMEGVQQAQIVADLTLCWVPSERVMEQRRFHGKADATRSMAQHGPERNLCSFISGGEQRGERLPTKRLLLPKLAQSLPEVPQRIW